jgi:hypothetical protein
MAQPSYANPAFPKLFEPYRTYIADNGDDLATATNRYRKWASRSRLVRQGVPRQSGSGRPLACRRSGSTPSTSRPSTRRKWLYRLPIFGIGVLLSGRPARALFPPALPALA